MECRDEMTIKILIIVGDRGYDKQAIVDMVTDMGLSYIFVFPDHLARFHPFVA